MDNKELKFYEACLKLLNAIPKELTPVNGRYYVEFNFFKDKCRELAESVFFEVGVSDIHKDTKDTNKALYIQEDGVTDAIEYYNNKINNN